MNVGGLHNFRDTGGTPLAEGGSTRHGLLYRSDALNAMTDDGLAQLAESPIGVIVDFRTPTEISMAPDRLPASRSFQVVELSILEGAMSGMAIQLGQSVTISPEAVEAALDTLPTLGELYIGMLQHSAAAFAQVARLVAASSDAAPSAVLVHCTAGKDRTGVATALLLDAVGAERYAVVADYASSAENLAGPWAEGMLAAIASMGVPLTPRLRDLVTATPASAIEQALAWVEAEHGDSAGYLRSSGLSQSELTALRSRLRG